MFLCEGIYIQLDMIKILCKTYFLANNDILMHISTKNHLWIETFACLRLTGLVLWEASTIVAEWSIET